MIFLVFVLLSFTAWMTLPAVTLKLARDGSSLKHCFEQTLSWTPYFGLVYAAVGYMLVESLKTAPAHWTFYLWAPPFTFFTGVLLACIGICAFALLNKPLS